jgi:hypothetical protein
MIRYALRCEREHAFEGWFASATAYDRAERAGANVCPICGSIEVTKAVMAPAVAGTRGGDEKLSLAVPDPGDGKLRQAIREFRRRVTEDAEYVGDRFAEEARKIHYDEAEPRSIYGEATPEEARSLSEEGVAFQPLPKLPEERN